MKYIFLSVIIVFFSACQKIDSLTQFNMDYTDIVVIPSAIGVNIPLSILSPETTTNAEAEFAVNDTRKDLIEQIKLTQLQLILESPSTEDFSFLNEISIYIAADSIAEQLIAWSIPVPNDANQLIELNLTDVDLQEYIKADQFRLRFYTKTDELLLMDHQIRWNCQFFVDAEILGI